MIAFIKKVVIKTIARFPFVLIFLNFLFLYAKKEKHLAMILESLETGFTKT